MKKFLFAVLLTCNVWASDITLDEMISEMIMIGVDGTSKSDKGVQELRRLIKNKTVNNVLLFGYNIKTPKQLKQLTTYLKSANENLVIAVDEEGGVVQRLGGKEGFLRIPSAKQMAQKATPKQAYNIYLKKAKELKKLGINLNFGPVVDLDINPNSPAIGAKKRSYSASSFVVIDYANAFLEAHKKAQVGTSLKHFPGHGSANADSHKGFTDITHTWQYKEINPYKYLIEKKNANGVLVSHLTNKHIDEKNPATLSPNIIEDLLRENMHFDGVVFSDDMQMWAITKNYTLEESVIKAINAGVDMLVYSGFYQNQKPLASKIHNIIKEAVQNNQISMRTIYSSYKRIIKYKKHIN